MNVKWKKPIKNNNVKTIYEKGDYINIW
jgi:hypothetical protein